MRNTCLVILMSIGMIACRKDASLYPDKTSQFTKTSILAHKAGGGSTNPYKENTLEAAVYGFSFLDGIETDIQKSRDGTLWLYHNEIIENMEGHDKRIPGLTDKEIKDIIKNRQLQMNTLEELLQWKQKNNNKDVISLDIKSWLPTRYSNTQDYLIELADEICKLSKKYGCSNLLLAECENAVCLKHIKKLDPEILCFLTTFENYDLGAHRALKADFDGLSFKYSAGNITKQQIKELHDKGLQIQLWTVNDWNEIKKALELSPDFIQTDNVMIK